MNCCHEGKNKKPKKWGNEQQKEFKFNKGTLFTVVGLIFAAFIIYKIVL